MGKNRTPAPKVIPQTDATLDAPIRLAQRSTVTNAAITRS
jgi:hypothetical protein